MPAAPQPDAIVRKLTPEDAELFRKRAELAALRNALAEREAHLAHLRARLNSFEGRYIRQVGVLYIQLDEWEHRIAELNDPPVVPGSEEDATPPIPDLPNPETTQPDGLLLAQTALDLKALFREVAKRIHPDFASDALDEQSRTRLMAHANDAYNRDDAPLLQRMLNGYDPSTGSGDLADVTAQIDQSIHDIDIINAEIDAITHSEMADLRDRTTLAAAEGRDLLAELAARVKGSIGIAMRRYELDLGRIRRKQPTFNPEPLLTAETIEPH
jgi:hypothetical protein